MVAIASREWLWNHDSAQNTQWRTFMSTMTHQRPAASSRAQRAVVVEDGGGIGLLSSPGYVSR